MGSLRAQRIGYQTWMDSDSTLIRAWCCDGIRFLPTIEDETARSVKGIDLDGANLGRWPKANFYAPDSANQFLDQSENRLRVSLSVFAFGNFQGRSIEGCRNYVR